MEQVSVDRLLFINDPRISTKRRRAVQFDQLRGAKSVSTWTRKPVPFFSFHRRAVLDEGAKTQ